ncbi:MAG: biotin--[acetyl-CoA-carboxylase] ligase [Candidatus Latescibacterota bacterium]|nr:MAG: biotin--[acetyl-CoA-carboxylase] ligase [Candidatus Latescibacterota bacterium]
MSASRDLLPHEIRARLSTGIFARRIYYVPEIDSTNRFAADLARNGEAEGTIVIADFQTAGRGRFERTWTSPHGRNLSFSLILRPEMSAGAALPITLACALSICETLERELGGSADVGTGSQTVVRSRIWAGVHWPNDVMIDDRKICGILSEGSTRGDRLEYVVIGVGVNVNMEADEFPPPSELRRPATSCRMVTDSVHDRPRLLAGILAGLEDVYRELTRTTFSAFVDRFDERLIDRGRTIERIDSGKRFVGRVMGVAADGGLRLEVADGGTITIYDHE